MPISPYTNSQGSRSCWSLERDKGNNTVRIKNLWGENYNTTWIALPVVSWSSEPTEYYYHYYYYYLLTTTSTTTTTTYYLIIINKMENDGSRPQRQSLPNARKWHAVWASTWSCPKNNESEKMHLTVGLLDVLRQEAAVCWEQKNTILSVKRTKRTAATQNFKRQFSTI